MNFYETKMGHTFFEHQVPELIRAIDSLTATLNKPVQTVALPVEADSEFLSDLYYGNYEPGTFKLTPESSELTQTINRAHAALEETLSEDSREKLLTYEDALTQRDTFEMKQAYESGFRTAVQMIMAGMAWPVSRRSEVGAAYE